MASLAALMFPPISTAPCCDHTLIPSMLWPLTQTGMHAAETQHATLQVNILCACHFPDIATCLLLVCVTTDSPDIASDRCFVTLKTCFTQNFMPIGASCSSQNSRLDLLPTGFHQQTHCASYADCNMNDKLAERCCAYSSSKCCPQYCSMTCAHWQPYSPACQATWRWNARLQNVASHGMAFL